MGAGGVEVEDWVPGEDGEDGEGEGEVGGEMFGWWGVGVGEEGGVGLVAARGAGGGGGGAVADGFHGVVL